MTEQERNQWMDKLEDLRANLAEATREYEAARHRVFDIEQEIRDVEFRFPECRFWPVAIHWASLDGQAASTL